MFYLSPVKKTRSQKHSKRRFPIFFLLYLLSTQLINLDTRWPTSLPHPSSNLRRRVALPGERGFCWTAERPVDQCQRCEPFALVSPFEVGEWDRLGRWLRVVWVVWQPTIDNTMETSSRGGALLFRRPAKRFVQRAEQWSEECKVGTPKFFKTREEAHEE